MFFALQKTDFHLFKLFAEKVTLELIAQNHFFMGSKNTNSVFSCKLWECEARMRKNVFLSGEKVAKMQF